MDLKQLISKRFNNIYCGEGDSEHFSYNFIDKSSIKYLLYHHTKYKVSLIFDLKRCRDNGYKRSCFSIPKELENSLSKEPISYCYRQPQNDNKFYEKVLLVADDYIEEFLENIDLYMQFNDFDDGFPQELRGNGCLNWATEERRCRESISRWKRDSEFRNAVLKRYKFKCAICRCDIKEILEAAHLKGHEVSKGVKYDDNPKYGICLCRNHHKLYDSDLIEINVKNLTIKYSDEAMKKHFLFKEFEEDYNSKLLQLE